MILRIACADTNLAYLERLTAVLGEEPDLRVSLYTETDALIRGASAGRFDVLLLDAAVYSPELPLECIPAVIFLGGETAVPAACAAYPVIRKYRRVSEIRRQILAICSENPRLSLGLGTGETGTAAICAVYSPVGGSGKTTASLIAAGRLAASGKRALYLNFEAFPSAPSAGGYLPASTGAGLSALFERLDGSDEQFRLFLESCVQEKEERFFYLRPLDTPNDYNAVTDKELSALLSKLRKTGLFDAILVDLDSAFDARTRAVFTLADTILLTERTDAHSVEKMRVFCGQTYLRDELGHKMKRVTNFVFDRSTVIDGFAPAIGRLSFANTADTAALISHKTASTESGFALSLFNA